jgi:SAM-dependent methyltransferase
VKTTASGADPFERDVAVAGGYRYTTDAPLSSCLANRRITDAVLAIADWHGRSVIDVGCGDGTYTAELVELGGATGAHGVDPAAEAVKVASERAAGLETLSFEAGDAYALPHADGSFDLAYLRGVLHHMDRPQEALREALRVAATVVVVEPNGLNLGVKLVERVSPYHREHKERSYAPRRLDRWVAELGGEVTRRSFVGFVPMFSPDRYARVAKRLEPALERLPLVRQLTCAQYIFSASSARR